MAGCPPLLPFPRHQQPPTIVFAERPDLKKGIPVADRSPRKLAVILHADVVGSTALVRINETLAHERIQGTFHRFSKTIDTYGGVAHELRGDALVAEFEKTSDAVSAALAFQAENSEFNAALDDDMRPQLRMGISMGEVVIADSTITGEGVVLAQRVEQLADPGGLCITSAIHETLPKRMPFDLENLGEQTLKGLMIRFEYIVSNSGRITRFHCHKKFANPELHQKPSGQSQPLQLLSSLPWQAQLIGSSSGNLKKRRGPHSFL